MVRLTEIRTTLHIFTEAHIFNDTRFEANVFFLLSRVVCVLLDYIYIYANVARLCQPID